MHSSHEPAAEDSVSLRPISGLGPREVLASVIALFLCLLIVFIAHYPLVPAHDEFDPSKCTAASKLSECWDDYMKAQGLKCVTHGPDGVWLRPGHRAQGHSSVCYKVRERPMCFAAPCMVRIRNAECVSVGPPTDGVLELGWHDARPLVLVVPLVFAHLAAV